MAAGSARREQGCNSEVCRLEKKVYMETGPWLANFASRRCQAAAMVLISSLSMPPVNLSECPIINIFQGPEVTPFLELSQFKILSKSNHL